MSLECRRIIKRLLHIKSPIQKLDLLYLGFTQSERACLIKEKDFGLGQELKGIRTLHNDIFTGCLVQSTDKAHRSRDEEWTWCRNHEHCQESTPIIEHKVSTK